MRARDGTIKVLDFGLARLAPDDPQGPTNVRLTVEGAIVGTPGACRPSNSKAVRWTRGPMCAFGVLLHELATGRLPCDGSTPRRLSGGDPPISPRLATIIRRCLAPNPADRFQNGAAIVAALEAAPAGGGAPHSPVRQTPLWWWQFHQLSIAALHASLLVGVWFARSWLDRPWRSLAFYGAIIAATADVTMRLNLSFASRVQSELLAAQRARLMRAVLASDALCARDSVRVGCSRRRRAR